MSKTKRFLAVLCTVAMLFSNVVPVSVPVYAAETESDPEYSNLIAKIGEEQVSDALDETEENKTPETLPEKTSQETKSDGEVADDSADTASMPSDAVEPEEEDVQASAQTENDEADYSSESNQMETREETLTSETVETEEKEDSPAEEEGGEHPAASEPETPADPDENASRNTTESDGTDNRNDEDTDSSNQPVASETQTDNEPGAAPKETNKSDEDTNPESEKESEHAGGEKGDNPSAQDGVEEGAQENDGTSPETEKPSEKQPTAAPTEEIRADSVTDTPPAEPSENPENPAPAEPMEEPEEETPAEEKKIREISVGDRETITADDDFVLQFTVPFDEEYALKASSRKSFALSIARNDEQAKEHDAEREENEYILSIELKDGKYEVFAASGNDEIEIEILKKAKQEAPKTNPEADESAEEPESEDEEAPAEEGKPGEAADGEDADVTASETADENAESLMPEDGEATEPAEEEDAPVVYLEADHFEESGDGYTILVYFDDHVFPEGTVMNVQEIRQGMDGYSNLVRGAEEAVTDDWTKTGSYQRFFDISFVNGEERIQPEESAVEVLILLDDVASIAPEEDIHVLHFDDQFNAEPVNAETTGSGENPEGVSFSADSFSTYAVTTTVSITKQIRAYGRNYYVTVEYGESADIPKDAKLIATEIGENDERYPLLQEKAAKALDADSVEFPGLYEISIVDKNDQTHRYQPSTDVKVSIRAGENLDAENLQVIHFEGTAEGTVNGRCHSGNHRRDFGPE